MPLHRNLSPTTTRNPWRRTDSNRRPPACKAGALPLSYAPARGITGTTTSNDQPMRIARNGRHQPVWAREDLNLRPHAYQACALTN